MRMNKLIQVGLITKKKKGKAKSGNISQGDHKKQSSYHSDMNLNTAFVFQETKRENKVNDPKQLGFRAAFSWVRHALLLQILFFQRKRSPEPKNINITALIYNSSIQA